MGACELERSTEGVLRVDGGVQKSGRDPRRFSGVRDLVGERGRVRRRRDDKASRESRLKRTAVGVVVGGDGQCREKRGMEASGPGSSVS